MTDVWSKGQKATRSTLNQARHPLHDANLDAPLGKRDEADLHRQQIEQSSAENETGDIAESPRPVRFEKDKHLARLLAAEIASSLIDEKLKAHSRWPADLMKKKRQASPVEVPTESKLQPMKIEKPKKEDIIIVKKVEDATISLANRKKIERWETMHEEEQLAKDKLVRRDSPFKMKSYTIEDIYYPEDFLVRGLFSGSSKMKSRRYIDIRSELAFPLSQNNILRNENVIDISQLEGRLYKYLDENDIVKTLQFMGSTGEELVFVDLHTNRRVR